MSSQLRQSQTIISCAIKLRIYSADNYSMSSCLQSTLFISLLYLLMIYLFIVYVFVCFSQHPQVHRGSAADRQRTLPNVLYRQTKLQKSTRLLRCSSKYNIPVIDSNNTVITVTGSNEHINQLWIHRFSSSVVCCAPKIYQNLVFWLKMRLVFVRFSEVLRIIVRYWEVLSIMSWGFVRYIMRWYEILRDDMRD